VDVADLDAEERARLRLEKIGFVFQGFNLLSRMDALHNVMMPLAYANAPLHERADRARAALESVGLGERVHHKPGEIDSRTSEEVMQLFESLCAKGHTIVLITHEADVARHAKRVCVMKDGVL